MLAVGTVGARVAGGPVDEAVPVHLVLALEAFAALAMAAALDGAEVGAVARVDVFVGAEVGC